MATADIGDGATAGIITGVIMGILSILLGLLGLASLMRFADVRSVLGGIFPTAGLAAASLTAMITLLLFMTIMGLILGAVFGAIHEDIPTKNLVTKGIIFLLGIWAILGLLIPIILSAGNALPAELSLGSIISSLVASVLWGGLLGVVFHWIMSRMAAPARTVARAP